MAAIIITILPRAPGGMRHICVRVPRLPPSGSMLRAAAAMQAITETVIQAIKYNRGVKGARSHVRTHLLPGMRAVWDTCGQIDLSITVD